MKKAHPIYFILWFMEQLGSVFDLIGELIYVSVDYVLYSVFLKITGAFNKKSNNFKI